MTTIDGLSIIAPANFVPGPLQGFWTYESYAALPDDGRRYEIMDGVLLMAPSPNPIHQSIVTKLSFTLCRYVEMSGLGRAFVAPLDVELTPKRVFQPDVLVLLNENLGKITPSHIVGAPDLVVEVASPGTAAYDRLSKAAAYAQAGVAEYWLVDVKSRSVEVLILTESGYQSQGNLQGDRMIPSRVLPGLSLSVSELF